MDLFRQSYNPFTGNGSYFIRVTDSWSMPMGVDYVVIGFDMEVQPLVTHNAACPLCVSAICIDVVSNHLLFAHMT